MFFFSFFPTTFMLRVSVSPAPECVEADCWNRAFPPPPCHQRLLLLLLLCCTRLHKRLRRELVFCKAIYTTLKYFGLCVIPSGWLAGWPADWLAGLPAGWPAVWLAGFVVLYRFCLYIKFWSSFSISCLYPSKKTFYGPPFTY